MRDPVENGGGDGDVAAEKKGKGDRRVDVAAGDIGGYVDGSEYSEGL